MTPEERHRTLGSVQGKEGFFFNPDQEWTLEVLAGLAENKKRYGYASCPCRLATQDPKRDREIICPCAFRDEDVRRYERCFCGLYVSEAAAGGEHQTARRVPDRWLRD